jgi:FKBP-type peptidyl-prolyl cis-trans isomerase FkpA
MMSRSRVAFAFAFLLLVAGCSAGRDASPGHAGHLGFSPEKVSALQYRSLQEKLATEPGAMRTGLGSVYREVKPGSGRAPERSDTVTVRYRAFDAAGTVVEDSRSYGGAVTVAVDELPPCLSQILMKMREGATTRVVCPMPDVDQVREVPPPLIVETTLVAVGAPLPPPGH